MAVIYSILCENGQATGSYFDLLSVTEKTRYGSQGAYRCYAGIQDWLIDRSVNSLTVDEEVLEIADTFTDTPLSFLIDSTFNAYSVEITTMVNGVRSSGFHNGFVTSGYCIDASAFYGIQVKRVRCKIDGIRVYTSRGGGVAFFVNSDAGFTELCNCIAKSTSSYGFTYRLGGSVCKYYNNLSFDSGSFGFYLEDYSGLYSLIYNNTAINSKIGFNGLAYSRGDIHNNIAFGNVDNNYSPGSLHESSVQSHNIGEPGDTVWGTDSLATLTENDFVDYAGKDFRPALSTSPQVDTGFDIPRAYVYDMVGVFRPNLSLTPSNDKWDRGCFEFDSGNGLPPVYYNFTLTGIPTGSEIRIYEKSATVGTIGTELQGIETWTGGNYTYTYSYTADVNIAVQVLSSGYEESITYYTLTANDQTIPIILEKEENL